MEKKLGNYKCKANLELTNGNCTISCIWFYTFASALNFFQPQSSIVSVDTPQVFTVPKLTPTSADRNE